MSIIAAKKLHEALAKARNVGLVEEPFTIEDCDLVLRNLRLDEYSAAIQDCTGLEGTDYMNTYQTAHIARAIIEVNGVDLRDVEYVEVEEEDPKNNRTKKVRLELHKYLHDHLLNTWGKEAIFIAYRKFGDVVELAERKAKAGITFIVPDETDEEKYRRLLLEAKELEGVLPGSLVDSILSDSGFVRKTSQEELQRVEERASQFARDLEISEPETELDPEPEPEELPPAPPPAPSRRPVDPHATLQQAIANRRSTEPAPAPQPRPTAPPPEEPKPSSRAVEYAQLEEEAFNLHPESATEVVEVKPKPQVDPKSLVVDPPVSAGINPRFRPPPKV
jgi:hypothetical protein